MRMIAIVFENGNRREILLDGSHCEQVCEPVQTLSAHIESVLPGMDVVGVFYYPVAKVIEIHAVLRRHSVSTLDAKRTQKGEL
jgi:hypothetical protein